MRSLKTALFAGGAALVLGLSGTAFAQGAQTHIMTVELPGGGVEQIRYTGNVAPQIVVTSSPIGIADVAPMPSLFGGDSPFAMMQQISADMDRQAAAMFRQADAMTAGAMMAGAPGQLSEGQLSEAALRNLPPGSESYTFVSTMSGRGVCSRSIKVTSMGNGAQPQVISHSSGDCGNAATGGVNATAVPMGVRPGTTVPTVAPAPLPSNRPDLLWTSAHGARPYTGMIRKVADEQR